MEIPQPNQQDTKEDYFSRVISFLKEEGKSQEEATIIANDSWETFATQHKMKEASGSFLVKVKEAEAEDPDAKIYTFYGETTVPDRTREVLPDGTIIEGEILSKKVLEKDRDKINNTSSLGGRTGSYRTISLFHNSVKENNMELEEAAFVHPTARVVPHKDYPGEWALEVDVETNKMYKPPSNYADYTPEKIEYKIQKNALGLSKEYNNRPDQEKLVTTDNGIYRYVFDSDDFRGFGFARPDLIGNPTAVRVKEISNAVQDKITTRQSQMDEAKIKELETKQAEADAKIKELNEQLKNADEAKTKELEALKQEQETKIKELNVAKSEDATKIKEAMELALASFAKIKEPAPNGEVDPDGTEVDAKLKEMNEIISNPEVSKVGRTKVKEYDWDSFKELCDAKIKENSEYLKTQIGKASNGIDLDEHRTLKVKCVGSRMVVGPTAKTKDVINTDSMAEGTYLQTNAFFADRYTPGITETFLMEDSLLTAMNKEQFAMGNDKYQWKIWTEFGSFDGDNTAAVNPNTTSVSRTQRDFIKLETPIREYRDGVEVTDFTQAHAAPIMDLMGDEIMRASEYVTNSMNADLYKAKVDATAGWLGFNGLIGIADSSTYSTIYGRVRSAANRLLDATLANTFVTTAEAITHSVVRTGYEKVLAHGAGLGNIAIAMHPTQVRKLFDSADNNVSGTANTSSILRGQLAMAGAPPGFGFSRSLIPHVDGIPIIRDYRCESSLAAQDMFVVVDMSPRQGFNLIVSKPLDVRGLAKVGTSETAYVSFWGQTVYKNVLNVFVHTSLTT